MAAQANLQATLTALVLAASVGCAAEPKANLADVTCTQSDFLPSLAMPEASAVAPIVMHGTTRLVVISDSGHAGSFTAIDTTTGAAIKSGQLPLGATSDDIEGATVLQGDLIGVTSAGWIYRWHFDDALDQFALVAPPYPLAPVDPNLPLDGGSGESPPPEGSGMACGAEGQNCGRNYESICLSPTPSNARDACVGLVVSKSEGHAYCLTLRDGVLQVDRDRNFLVGLPGALADCAIDAENRAWIGANILTFGRVFVLTHWDKLPAAPIVQRTDDATIGVPEGIAVVGADVYRFSDAGKNTVSAMAKYSCVVP